MMSGTPSEDFKSRVDAVFGALDTTHEAAQPSKGWSLSEKQIYRPGKDASYSSEEEEEAKKDQAEREDTLGQALDLDDQIAEGQELPSRAFCKAIDNEQEFDANDVIASGIVDGQKDPRPSRRTQVLDDNTYEERSRLKANIPVPLQSQGHRSAGPLQEVSEPDQDLTLPSQAVKTEGSVANLSQQQPALGWGSSRPPLPARPPRRQRRGKGGSFVPDHVRHPERYTMYELEEPLVVGSGDFGAADSQPRKEAEIGGAENSGEPQHLPEFGGGIAFTPKEKNSGPSSNIAGVSNQQAAPDIDSRLSFAQPAESDPEDAVMEEAVPDSEGSLTAPTEFLQKPRRQRNIRNKA